MSNKLDIIKLKKTIYDLKQERDLSFNVLNLVLKDLTEFRNLIQDERFANWTCSLSEKVRKEFEEFNYNLNLYKSYNDNKIKFEQAFLKESSLSLFLEKTFSFFSSTIDDLIEKYLKSLEVILNDSYHKIYNNSKDIKLIITEKYNKKVMQLQIVNKGQVEDIFSQGHGVRVALGTILLIYFIIWNNLEKIVFFDETFSCFDDETLENFMGVLKEFVKYGFTFVIISHDTRLVNYSDFLYKVDNGRITKMS